VILLLKQASRRWQCPRADVCTQSACVCMRSDTNWGLFYSDMLISMLMECMMSVLQASVWHSEWPNGLQASRSCLYISAWHLAEGGGTP
jgi:hypothetical protein